MAIDKKDAKVTRLDLRIPNEIYAQVEEIAKANNAPSHHISGNIILSPTLLKLINLGIRSLSGNYSELADITPNISQLSDTSSTRIDAIAGELENVKKSLSKLSDKLSVYISDTIPDIVSDIVPDTMPGVVADTMPDTIPDSKEGELEPAAIAPTPPPLVSHVQNPAPNSKAPAVTPNRSPIVYPIWVNNSNRPFFNKVQRDPSLLPKVAEVMERNTNNNEAGKSLASIGLHKGDGSVYSREEVSRIRSAIKHFIEDLQLQILQTP